MPVSNASTTTVIFDFDGTIADTMEATIHAYNRVAQQMRLPAVTAEILPELRKMTALQAVRTYGIPIWKVPRITAAVRRGMRELMDVIRPFPGIAEVIARLRQMGVVCGILSSNSKENVNSFLSRHRIHEFDIISCGASIFGKTTRLKSLILRSGLSPSRVFYVGDEMRDIIAANEAGTKSMAVSWGYTERAALAGLNPDHLIDTPEQLPHLLVPE